MHRLKYTTANVYFSSFVHCLRLTASSCFCRCKLKQGSHCGSVFLGSAAGCKTCSSRRVWCFPTSNRSVLHLHLLKNCVLSSRGQVKVFLQQNTALQKQHWFYLLIALLIYIQNLTLSLFAVPPSGYVSDWDLGVCLQYECKRKQLHKPDVLNSWIDLRSTYKVSGSSFTSSSALFPTVSIVIVTEQTILQLIYLSIVLIISCCFNFFLVMTNSVI